jgi:RNA recognition motif-containing protein
MQENGQPPATEPVCKRLHVGRLTRNVHQGHVQEIFSSFGTLKSVELATDKNLKLSRGFAHVEYESLEGAQAAIAHMDGGQLDGNFIT